MNKDSTMTFRVEPGLREEFHRVAESMDRPAAQLIREFMRVTVERAQAPAPRISEAERLRREDALRFAQASVGLEGFEVPEELQAQMQRYVAGEIDLETVMTTPYAFGRH